MKVMVKVAVEFHELYGFSLNITDIEPSFTIGEMAQAKTGNYQPAGNRRCI